MRILSTLTLFSLVACGGAEALDDSSGAAVLACPAGTYETDGACVTDIPDFIVDCAGDGQSCDQVYAAEIETTGLLEVSYAARTSHCSSVRVTFWVDGVPAYTSESLTAGNGTGLIALGPVDAGVHSVWVSAEGEEGGCNAGALYSWGGVLQLRGSAEWQLTEQIAYSEIEDFVVECPGESQSCDNTFETTIETASVLEVNYIARASHCSSITVTLLVDGEVAFVSSLLGFGAFYETGSQALGPVAPGTHTLSVRAEGYEDGCNAGELFSWGGALQIRTSYLE